MSPRSGALTHQGSEDISVTQRMISATCGSILTSLLVTPLDVVRVRLQAQSTSSILPTYTATKTHAIKNLPPNLGVTACCREVVWLGDGSPVCVVASADCAVEETQRKTFHSTLDGLRKIARNEGVFTLWRGLSPTLMMGIPANVIYFAGYDWLRFGDHSPIKHHVPTVYAPLVAGSFARVAAASLISPIEMFRTRLQATPGHGAGHFRATLQGLSRMTQSQGYSSLWRGLNLTLWRDVPFSGMYWWGYEEVRSLIAERRKDTSAPSRASLWLDSFISGAVSGCVAAFITTPFDVGKTRQQVFRHLGDELLVSGKEAARVGTASTASTTLHPEQLSLPKFLMHIFREEGMAGLFRGWAARCLKVAPACAIMISTYEAGKMMAQGVNERRHSGSGDEL